MPGCAPRGAAAADKSGPDAASDALKAQRVASLRIFCQARPSLGLHASRLGADASQ